MLNRSWRHWELFGDCPVHPPRPPMRRRLEGFGKLNPNLTVRHSTPSPYFILHKAWIFLDPSDRYTLAQTYKAFRARAILRRSVPTVAVNSLRDPRPAHLSFEGLQHDRAWRMAVTLLRFDFDYGDFIRWLEGEYTNAHRDWSSLSDTINAVSSIPAPPGYPSIDFERTFRICTEGTPLAGHYECSLAAVQHRNVYDNHPGLQAEMDNVREKLAKEEAQSFHIALPRFLWRFIVGLHLSPFAWAWRKGKGRLCVDPSSTIAEDDDGAANASIPAPGTDGREDECPPIYYSTAFKRHITRIWNLRIEHPEDDILQYVDDIQAAFHRVLYHPDAMKVFASVVAEFLILPVGSIFGARHSPSFFTILSEMRSHSSSNQPFRDNDEMVNLTPLAQRIRLIPPPTPREAAAIVRAVPDDKHQGIFDTRYHNATFVDDNGITDTRLRIRGAIDNSVRSAFAIFGAPEDDRRPSCLSEEKWLELCSYAMHFLGFYIDTRLMIVAWPVEKRLQLASLIDEFSKRSPCILTPSESSSVLGLIRNGGQVAPLGIFLSLRLQHALNEAVKKVWKRRRNPTPGYWRKWYRKTGIKMPSYALRDLQLLRLTLDDNENHPVWSRYIGLLVDREPTHQCLSDASYSGIGAFSEQEHFNFRWRLFRADLIQVGFDMKSIDDDTCEPDGTSDGLHINVLEFVTMIIELWFVIVICQRRGPHPGGYIVQLIGDNTSAISWLRYAARSHRPIVRELSRFAMALTLACPHSIKLSGEHLKGDLNKGADALSRPTEYPTWASATQQHSPLSNCQAFRVPYELLYTIAMIISSAKTGVLFEPEMTKLLNLELTTLSVGFNETSTQSSFSRGSHRAKRSR